MKKWIKLLIIILSILTFVIGLIVGVYTYRIKTAKIDITFNNLEVEFNDKVSVSSFIKFINGKIIDDYKINTTELGSQEINFQYINDDNIKINYSFNIEVVDKTPPLIWLNDTFSLPVGSDTKLEEVIMCGDNYDSRPNCFVEGDYDLNTIGKYPLTYRAIDNSNNEANKNFILNVYEPKKYSNNYSVKTNFDDIVNKHKNSKTKIGLDISKWQGEVDFEELKNSGVEFVILRVGGTRGTGGEYFLDEYFERNITEANKYNIPVGIYFYSYASSIKQAKDDAKWVVKQLKDYDISLPVAFDWEDWSNFNTYNVSFYELTEIAKSFMRELEKAGYDTMLYSSKTYLEKIWLETKYDTWLAHYTDKTNYEGKYKFWQLCNNGRVAGINGDVDIDILYLD